MMWLKKNDRRQQMEVCVARVDIQMNGLSHEQQFYRKLYIRICIEMSIQFRRLSLTSNNHNSNKSVSFHMRYLITVSIN